MRSTLARSYTTRDSPENTETPARTRETAAIDVTPHEIRQRILKQRDRQKLRLTVGVVTPHEIRQRILKLPRAHPGR